MLDVPEQDRLGPKLRTLRQQRGLTLDRLADMSDLTRGYLSLVERGLKTPSIGALLRLTAALDTTVAQLFGPKATQGPRYTLQRAAEAQSGNPLEVIPLAPGRARKTMEPFLLRPPSGGGHAKPRWTHGGDEMLFVVSGRVAVVLSGEELLLEKGDCLYFSGEEKHEVRNIGPTQAEVLVIVSLNDSHEDGHQDGPDTKPEPAGDA